MLRSKCFAIFLVVLMLFSIPFGTVYAGQKESNKDEAFSQEETVDLDAVSETTETSDGKTVEIRVEAVGLAAGTEVVMTLVKSANGDEPDLILTETTVNLIAVFQVPFGGSCTISGGNVPGYSSANTGSIELTGLKGDFLIYAQITYTLEELISVTGLNINNDNLFLLEGESATLVANTVPGNATNQEIVWDSSDNTVATVSEGTVIGLSSGIATITASISEGDVTYSSICEVTVACIIDFSSGDTLIAFTGEVMILANQVEANLDRGGSVYLDVLWLGASLVGDVQRISFDTEGTYVVYGIVDETSMQPQITIIVEQSEVGIVPETATLDKYTMGLFVGDSDTLTASVDEGVSPDTLIWVSDDSTIASVDPGSGFSTVVTGKKIGTTTIQLKNYLGMVLATCIVSVTVDPVPPIDEVYILATTQDSEDKVDEFKTREDVWLRGFNLEPGHYFIKVTDKGSGFPLGQGEIEFTLDQYNGNQILFNLYDTVAFGLTKNYSKEYFIYMSKDSRFPMGDDENGIPRTLMTNFRIGSPVPTASIIVNVHEIVDGENAGALSEELIGVDVLLVRELDGIEPIDTNVSDYLNPLYGSDDESIPIELRTAKYTDEVKMVGHITADGTVVWDDPKEKLKIGGYYLLLDLPEGYISSLDLYDPYSEDGTFLKEVHLTRNDVIIRDVYVYHVE